ncbi:MAG: hypothetical protein JF612_03575, partial [Planctomycetia bacterium]|nr:hypothetical protein [Planctomycetia bacterium]
MQLLETRKKTTRRDFRQRKFFLEPLESRALLAGNVSVALNSVTGSLLITGDKKDNNVAITENASGDLTLTSNSKINGQNSPFDLTEFLNSNRTFNGDVVVDLGAGNDTLSVTGNAAATPLSENLTVNGGAGADAITLTDLNTTGDVTINAGDGNDTVNLTGGNVANLTINVGTGHDSVSISNTDATGDVTISALGSTAVTKHNKGHDDKRDDEGDDNSQGDEDEHEHNNHKNNKNKVVASAGANININGLTADTLTITSSAFNDNLTLTNVTATGAATVTAGAGNDVVNVSGLTADSASI